MFQLKFCTQLACKWLTNKYISLNKLHGYRPQQWDLLSFKNNIVLEYQI